MEKRVYLFALILLLVITQFTLVSAEEFDFTETKFYEVLRPFIVPDVSESDVGEGGAFIIGLVSLLILLVVFWDILSLVPIFSANVSKLIAVGLAIIMLVFKLNVKIAAWVFTRAAVIFGFGGTLAVAAMVVIGIIIMVGLIFGSSKIGAFVAKMRGVRQEMEAREDAEKINALQAKADAVK